MSYTKKTLKDLTIRDNFLFAAVMQQEDNCKQFLEMLLDIQIERIDIQYEKTLIFNPEDISPHLLNFLTFVRENNPLEHKDYHDSYVSQLQNSIFQIKQNQELGSRYMLLELMLKDEYKKGILEGKAEGKIEGKAESIIHILSTGNTDPVPMSFRHALAAVRFIFQKGSQTTVDYHLMSFDLQYLLSVGTLVFNSIAQDASLDSQWWVADDFRPASLYPWSGDIQVPSAYANWPGTGSPEWEEWHCVLPQKLRNTSTEEKPSVRFSSSIKTGSDYSDPAFTIIELPETYTYIDGESVQHTVDAVWEAGKKYTYYIQIQPSGASIKVYATDWDSYKVAVEDLMF